MSTTTDRRDSGDIGDKQMGTDDWGQFIVRDARVYIYPVGSHYEVDICAGDGAIGFDIPQSAVSGKGEIWRALRHEGDITADIPIEGTPSTDRIVQAVTDTIALRDNEPTF